MRRFTVLCVYYTISFVESTLKNTNSRFVAYPGFGELLFEENKLGSIHVESPILCCAICKGNSSCLSAFHNNDNKICTLYGKVFKPTETGLTSEAGSKYYYYSYYADEDETNSTTTDVTTTSNTKQTTSGSSPTIHTDNSSDLTIQNYTKYFEIEPIFFEVAAEMCMAKCKTDHCHLAWIYRDEENDDVTETVRASHYAGEYFYIGHVLTGEEIRFFPTETVASFRSDFEHFNSSLKCIATQASGKWTSIDCYTVRRSICQHEWKFSPRD